MRLGTVRFRQAPGFRHIVYSPDGQFVVTDGGQYRLMVLDARDGKNLRQIDLGFEGIGDLVFSPDGKTIAAVGFQLEPKRNVVVNHLVLADAATGRVVHRAGWDDQDNVGRVAYVPDGKTIATVSSDSTLRLWDVAATKLLHRERGSSTPTSTIVWLDSQTGHVRREIEVPESYVNSLAFSPDGQAIAVGTMLPHPARGIVRIFRLRDKHEIQTIESPCPWINALSFTTDGRRIVTGLSDTSIVIWDVRSTDY
jgi:WD40 repeat protein